MPPYAVKSCKPDKTEPSTWAVCDELAAAAVPPLPDGQAELTHGCLRRVSYIGACFPPPNSKWWTDTVMVLDDEPALLLAAKHYRTVFLLHSGPMSLQNQEEGDTAPYNSLVGAFWLVDDGEWAWCCVDSCAGKYATADRKYLPRLKEMMPEFDALWGRTAEPLAPRARSVTGSEDGYDIRVQSRNVMAGLPTESPVMRGFTHLESQPDYARRLQGLAASWLNNDRALQWDYQAGVRSGEVTIPADTRITVTGTTTFYYDALDNLFAEQQVDNTPRPPDLAESAPRLSQLGRLEDTCTDNRCSVCRCRGHVWDSAAGEWRRSPDTTSPPAPAGPVEPF